MMTADSLLNVNTGYDSLYQKLGQFNVNQSSPKSDKDFGPSMSYRFLANNKQLSPPVLYNRAFDEVDEMEVDRNVLLSDGKKFFKTL